MRRAAAVGLCLVLQAAAASWGASDDRGAAAPPADAQWTILCMPFTTPDHNALARGAKDYWQRKTGLRDFYVVHEAQQSTLYYGYFRSINDPKDRKETQRARAERARIDALTDDAGQRPFRGCIFTELAPQDPPAPAEWNLANSDGYWSLQIGVYRDSPLRKQYAVDAVKEARARGIPAYFYHGPTSSSVCIGSWPRAAVKEQEASSGGSLDPAQPVLVGPEMLTQGKIIKRDTGQVIKQMAPKLEPLDPTLLKAIEEYPEQRVNGERVVNVVDDPNGGKTRVPMPSYLVLVPRAPGVLADSAPRPPELGKDELPSAFAPPPPPPPSRGGSGRLKSLDGK